MRFLISSVILINLNFFSMLKEEMLKKYIKADKVRRNTLLSKWGYRNEEDFYNKVKGENATVKKTEPVKVKKTPVALPSPYSLTESTKVGDVLSVSQFVTVTDIGKSIFDTWFDVITEKNQRFRIQGRLEGMCNSASYVSSTKTISRTELIEVFNKNSGVVMTVNFNKKVDVEKAKKDLITAINGSKLSEIKDAVSKTINSVAEGEERTMVGYHNGEYNDFGRMEFHDMHVTQGYNGRQVDPRTLNWMIVKGVKYIAKV